jgi:secreted trypsin-like serine protease
MEIDLKQSIYQYVLFPLQGDSGGPMACRSSSNSDFVVVGIASWVISGCNGSYPSVYVRIAHFLDWLTDLGVSL